MIVYGRNAVLEALRGKREVERVWVASGEHAQGLPGTLEAELGSPGKLASIASNDDHQGFVAEVADYPYVEATALLEPADALVIALDQIQDPHNLGAICRTAEAAGATGLVIPQRRSAEVTPAVCKASAGAVEHLAIARVRNLHDFLQAAKGAAAWVYGADADAEVPYTHPDYSGRCVLVMGAEGKGLRPRVAAACDQLVSIPMRGMVKSLNVSAAAAILIYAARRAQSSNKRSTT